MDTPQILYEDAFNKPRHGKKPKWWAIPYINIVSELAPCDIKLAQKLTEDSPVSYWNIGSKIQSKLQELPGKLQMPTQFKISQAMRVW